jgi:hypothetical protein
MADGSGKLPSEHHVELREAEDECVTLVDKHDIHRVAERLGEDGCQLEASKPRAEHDHSRLHTHHALLLICPFNA